MEFSVIIPTHERASLLGQTLEAIAVQKAESPFEVLVIDDGSRDETPQLVRQIQKSFPVPLHYLYQPNRKQGAARNLGARQADGDWLLFLGDDIVPEPGFIDAHQRAHRQVDPASSSSRSVVIGYTTWPETFRRNRFREYIGEQGWQFGFSLIEDSEDVPFNFFYTSNLSLSKQFFFRAGGFDEDFREYGWEDIELSLRLEQLGMQLIYRPAAVGRHHHEITLSSFRRRQRKVGFSAWNFYRKHPEMESFLSVDRLESPGWRKRLKMKLLGLACELTENWNRPDLSGYYPDLLSYHYMEGLRMGRRAFKDEESSRG